MSTIAAAGLYVNKPRATASKDQPASLFDRLALYYRRTQERRHLLTLDDRMLRDIGISRVDALREAGKPFWKP